MPAAYCDVFGVLPVGLVALLQERGADRRTAFTTEVMHDLFHMPKVMRQLAVVQFFSWFAMFAMWIYSARRP